MPSPSNFHLTGAISITNRTGNFLAPGLAEPGRYFVEVESVARPELGSKHQCQSCGTRFFDLNRSPVACPKCGTVVEQVPHAPQHAVEAQDEDAPAGAENELVSLEEADAEEAKEAPAGDEEEVEIDTDEDTFLEEEDEDGDDVGDLIDSDIRDEEER
jgi:uncharacterized protein (TIGR02300 family)